MRYHNLRIIFVCRDLRCYNKLYFVSCNYMLGTNKILSGKLQLQLKEEKKIAVNHLFNE